MTSGPLVSKIGKYKAVLLTGAGISILAAVLMTFLGVGSALWMVIAFMIVAGLGFGPSQSIFAIAIQNSVPVQEVGQATSAAQFTRQIGSTIGAAIMGVVFSTFLTAGFEANMPKNTGMESSMEFDSSKMQTMGPAEIRATIYAKFESTEQDITQLYTLRGQDAVDGHEKLMQDTAFPQEFKDRLKDGTPAMQIEKGFSSLLSALKTAVIGGNIEAVKKILASSPVPIDSQAEKGILQVTTLPAPARPAGFAQLEKRFNAMLPELQDSVTAKALPPVIDALEKTKVSVADSIIEGIVKSFASAVHNVWLVSIIFSVMTALAVIFMPSLKLRGKDEAGPSLSH
jgi:hypothetical protein